MWCAASEHATLGAGLSSEHLVSPLGGASCPPLGGLLVSHWAVASESSAHAPGSLPEVQRGQHPAGVKGREGSGAPGPLPGFPAPCFPAPSRPCWPLSLRTRFHPLGPFVFQGAALRNLSSDPSSFSGPLLPLLCWLPHGLERSVPHSSSKNIPGLPPPLPLRSVRLPHAPVSLVLFC